MNGYQPEKRCIKCLKFDICKKKYKNQVCKNYKECRLNPPTTGTNAQTPTYIPPLILEVKPPKQRTVLSVRDFAILYNIVSNKIMQMESQAQTIYWSERNDSERIEKERAENMERLHQDPCYKDLLRIRDKLGELNIEVETPSVEVE